MIPVRYAIATDLAVDGEQADGRRQRRRRAAATRARSSVLADPRTNSLMLRAPSAARANLAKSLIAKLDQPTRSWAMCTWST